MATEGIGMKEYLKVHDIPDDLAASTQPQPKRPYQRPVMQEFGKLHRMTGGPSTGGGDGASGMMQP
jgi:hypothetical protein